MLFLIYLYLVKTIFKNIFLTLCFAVYCFSVFSNINIPSFEQKTTHHNQEERAHFTALSKILFPQSISTEGHNVSVVHAAPVFDLTNDKAQFAAQSLSELLIQRAVNYFKETESLRLKFRSVDIIFPFHNFW
ncbi:hypothetical protein [Brumimicrobium sp.]|uniref:hypothetical protein n=1 Tax=Brumimicrobium sp. TaxID=2029867 RepID=UPI003A92589A